MTLDPRRLRLLVELADRGTIAAVADALHFAPSTVSHGLSALEREVGVMLLERTGRSVRLTPAGVALAQEGRVALARLQAAAADAAAVGRLDGGQVVIATFPSAGATFVTTAFRALRAQRPRLDVRLRDAEPEASLPAVLAGEVDVAVVYAYPHLPPLELDGLEAVHLLDDPMRLLIAADDPLAQQPTASVDALRDRAFVAGARGSACWAFARAVCRHAGFEPEIAFETEDVAFMCALIDAAGAVAIMPELLISTPGRRPHRLELQPRRPIAHDLGGAPRERARAPLRASGPRGVDATMIRILLLSGSLRDGSTNTAVLRTARALAPGDVEAVLYAGMGSLPHFSPDDDPDGGPVHPAVAELRAALHGADAVLICTPEYAGALPGSFKNMLEWTVGDASTYGKPVAWINASGRPGPEGAADAHESLRKVLGYVGADIVEAAVTRLPVTRAAVGDDGLVGEPELREAIGAAVAALAADARIRR